MKRCICMLCAALLLTGCTDIRERLLPDLLAVDFGETVQFAAHTSQDEAVISAAARTDSELCEALQNASGARVSTGHLTMLAVSGNPCAVTEDYLQQQILAPTCMVLCVPRSACTMLTRGALPEPDMLQAAVDTGMLPCRTADAVIGDLWGGSGITALHTCQNGRLTLSLWDITAQYAESLSQDACRGLALFGTRWETFALDAEGETFRITEAALDCRLSPRENGLQIRVCGTLTAEPPLNAAAKSAVTAMLAAAVNETAVAHGADILFLRETAVRDGIADAASCSQQAWRAMLRDAVCEVDVSFTG